MTITPQEHTKGMSDADKAKERWIKYEAARNEAMETYFNARSYIIKNRSTEMIFEGGFRMAWEKTNDHNA